MFIRSNLRKNLLLIILSVIISFSVCQKAQAATLIFDAFDKGWWANNLVNNSFSENYFVGTVRGSDHRNFFSFDLSTLNATVTSARLELTAFQVEDTVRDPFSYDLYNIITPIPTLNDTNLGFNVSVYNDLGSGTSYGSHPTNIADGFYPNLVLLFGLNGNAVADINAAAGSNFALGGSLSSIANGNRNLFGLSANGGIQRLVLETDSQGENRNVIPEPTTLLLFGSGIFGAFVRRRIR